MGAEVKTARVSARITPSVYGTLSDASAITGSTLNQFLVQAALEKAHAVIEHENKIKLNRKSTKHLLELIENPPQINQRLLKVVKKYKQDMGC